MHSRILFTHRFIGQHGHDHFSHGGFSHPGLALTDQQCLGLFALSRPHLRTKYSFLFQNTVL